MTLRSTLSNTAAAEPSRAGFEAAVRPQRVLLSVAAGVLIALAHNGGRLAVGVDVRAVIIAVAVANGIWNAAHLTRKLTSPSSRRLDVVQLGVDSFLALATAAVADAQDSPLIWILLLVPVFDAAVRFGAVGAAIGWLGVSSAYVFMLSALSSPTDVGQDAVGRGLQQIAVVAGVAIPMLAIVSRLRSELDTSARARSSADAQQSQLRGISHAAREFSDTRSPEEVLQLVVRAALRLGFHRADVCLRTGGEAWRLRLASGSPSGVDPERDGLLARSAVSASLASVGISEPGDNELQDLHNLGYQAAVVAVVQISNEEWLGVRAYCASAIAPGSPILESIETLTSLCASSWVSARTRESLEHQKRQADYESKHDSLTGVPNRSSVIERLQTLLRLPGSQTAVMFIDLNGFKAINDQLGHAAGDATLIGVANRLKSLSTSQIFMARLGGDEFVLITTGIARPELEHIARAAVAKITEPIDVGGRPVSVGASIGVAEHNGEDETELMMRADQLMYQAKQESRKRSSSVYCFASNAAMTQPA